MSNLEIFCVTNKRLNFLENFSYKLCSVGTEKLPNFYLTCNTKDNIFQKEKYYSELTFHYWYWKNELNLNNKNWVGFCQKRRFWVKKDTIVENINEKNLKENLLIDVPSEWHGYDSIVCKSVYVNNVKKSKMLKRGLKSIIKNPSIFFNKNKQNLNFHFDMYHGYGNLNKATDLMNEIDKSEFKKFVHSSVSFNPHIMLISKPEIMHKWFGDLFDWLFKCEKVFGFKNLKGYDTKRLYAFLAERYLSYWFKRHSKCLEWPWVFFE